jgi:uncharacterized membrane protein
MTDPAASFSLSEPLRFGWNKTLAQWRPLFIIGCVGGFLALTHQSLLRAGEMGAFLAFGVQLLQAAVMLVLWRAALAISDGEAVQLDRWREQLSRYLPYLLTTVLYGLVVTAGLVLLIVPGLIWAAQFAFAPLVTIDRAADPIDALRESSRLTRGLKGRLWLFGLTCLGINVVGALALGVGLLVTIPTTAIAVARVFRLLQARSSEHAPPAVGTFTHPAVISGGPS